MAKAPETEHEPNNQPADEVLADTTKPEVPPSEPERGSKIKRFFRGYWLRKRWTIPLTILLALLIVMAVPLTRYWTLGWFIKQSVSVSVLDSKTKAPVSGAQVRIGGQILRTNAAGIASARIRLGSTNVEASKQYYASASQSTTVSFSKASISISLAATGRQVPVTVVDKVSLKALSDAEVTVAGTQTLTDKNGRATIVLPTDKPTQAATAKRKGYNDLKFTIQVTDKVVAANRASLTPAGKLYFLSNATGKIDVVKTDLDGTNRSIVLPGTGDEDRYTTSMLASRDWKYLALLSKRDGKTKLFLIDTTDGDKVTTIDEADASFELIGWSNSRFVYKSTSNVLKDWQPGRVSLKSYDAASNKRFTLEQSAADGDQYNWSAVVVGNVYIFPDEIVYENNHGYSSWGYRNGGDNGRAVLLSVRDDGANKKVIKQFTFTGYTSYVQVETQLYEPDGLYVRFHDGNASGYHEYDNGEFASAPDMRDDKWGSIAYPTYLWSPNGSQTFWSDSRDGKNALSVGGPDGSDAKQVALSADYTPYGWYGSDYLLVSKNRSEIYIMPVSGTDKPLKISDYYRPNVSYSGYGGGYGGL